MSEKAEIKRDGARPVANSGRGWKEKGDAVMGPFTVDYKESAKSFTLNTRVWAKVAKDALHNRTIPALKIILGEEIRERLWIVQEEVIHDYVRLLAEEERRNNPQQFMDLGGVITGDMEK